MANPPYIPTLTSDQAAQKLSDHMEKHLDVVVNQKHLENYLLAHWSKVSFLAHVVHGSPPHRNQTEHEFGKSQGGQQ